MKEKYLIALDLDGTLLSEDRKITPPTIELIKDLILQGHVVVIATGRSNKMSILYYEQLGLTTPLINSNGAVIHHPLDKNWKTKHFPLERKTAFEIVEAGYQFNSKNILAALHDNVYLERYDENIWSFFEQGVKTGDFVVGRILDTLKENPTLMLLYPEKDQLEELTNHLNDIHAEVIDHRNWGEPFHIIEIMNKSMNKAIALKQVADHYQIPRERIIAFGDELNDMEMIDYAGIGVAMGNAVDPLKTVAKHITLTNEEHGVAAFLKDFFNVKTIELQ